MEDGGVTGGEPDAERLLQLAIQEVAEEILPEIAGDARYRARLVLNALKISLAELRDRGRLQDLKREQLAPLRTPSGNQEAAQAVLCELFEREMKDAIRAGRYDGDAALHRALMVIVEDRCRLAGQGP